MFSQKVDGSYRLRKRNIKNLLERECYFKRLLLQSKKLNKTRLIKRLVAINANAVKVRYHCADAYLQINFLERKIVLLEEQIRFYKQFYKKSLYRK